MRRALAIAALLAAVAGTFQLAAGTEPSPSHFPQLLRGATEPELVWQSGSRNTAWPGSVLAHAAALKVSVLSTFAGVSSADTQGDPPDPIVGVGAGFVVQMVNSAVRVWTTDGVARATYPLASFVDAASDDVSDPRIVFDPTSGRWFASAVDVARASVQIAVSAGSDPTGPWTVYSHANGSCPDQPSLGISPSSVVVGYGAYSAPCRSDPAPSYLGGASFVYDKQQLLDGAAAQAVDWGPRPDLSPLDTPGLTNGPATALGFATPRRYGPTYLAIVRLEPQPTVDLVPIRALTPPPPAEQADARLPVETNDVRILSAAFSRQTLWLAGNDSCVPPRDNELRSCLRIIAVTKNRIGFDADIGSRDANDFYPALAPDRAGNMVVVHGFSSHTAYPGLSAFAITPRQRRTREVVLAQGAGPSLSNRFGDYSGAATDTGGRVWVTGETGALPDGDASTWATTVASLSTQLVR
jgi:hypothetical protein